MIKEGIKTLQPISVVLGNIYNLQTRPALPLLPRDLFNPLLESKTLSLPCAASLKQVPVRLVSSLIATTNRRPSLSFLFAHGGSQ
jgi:hypothetical protein